MNSNYSSPEESSATPIRCGAGRKKLFPINVGAEQAGRLIVVAADPVVYGAHAHRKHSRDTWMIDCTERPTASEREAFGYVSLATTLSVQTNYPREASAFRSEGIQGT